jgi:diguanylate cyclase (GGDEF)-like protein
MRDGTAVRVSASVGVATYPADGTDPTVLVQTADSALYRAKGRGGNCVALSGVEAKPAAGAV